MPYKDPFKYKETQRRYYRNRRAIHLSRAQRLLGGRCVVCGSGSDLEFDHIDPTTKRFVIGQRAGTAGWRVLLDEILKCQLLCSTCHLDKTLTQRRGEEWVPPDPWDLPVYDEDDDLF